MSDQIKTQHGTIGPIMAECEQLRRDLAQAHKDYSDSDQRWREAWNKQGAELARARAENQRLTEQLESHAWEVSPAMAQAKIDQLQAENARLAASCAEMAEACRQICSPIRPHWRTTLEAASNALNNYNDGTALSDLLAPTIALEERFSTVRAGHLPECPCERCMLARELLRDAARLRSILPSKETSDKKTP